MSLEAEWIVRRNLTLRGVHNYAPVLREAVSFLTAHHTKFPFSREISPARRAIVPPIELCPEEIRVAHQRLTWLSALALVLASAPLSGQSETPRTAWGDPDLQGVWANNSATPLA